MRLHLDHNPASELPADLRAILEQIDAADQAAEVLRGRLTEEQFHWRPDGGRRWSVAQCLEHLATINVLYTDAIWQGVSKAQANRWERRGPAVPGLFGRWFVKSLEPPVRMRTRAPGAVRPGSELSRAEILQRYHEAHDRVRQVVRAAAGIDANRATFPNPFFTWASVTVSTGLHAIPAHDRRHLWQADQVTLHPAFPRGSDGGQTGVRPGSDP
jgi:hypothetical protein